MANFSLFILIVIGNAIFGTIWLKIFLNEKLETIRKTKLGRRIFGESPTKKTFTKNFSCIRY